MKPANERPYLRYFFGYGSGVCLWTGNDVALNRFGDYAIDTEALPLSANTRHWLQHLIAWYDTGLDWDDPGGGASPWSDEERARFNLAAQAGFRRTRNCPPKSTNSATNRARKRRPTPRRTTNCWRASSPLPTTPSTPTNRPKPCSPK